jgi:hypothetical protein
MSAERTREDWIGEDVPEDMVIRAGVVTAACGRQVSVRPRERPPR